jgi:hypothetical protein
MEQNTYAILGLKRKRAHVAGSILTLEQQIKALKADLAALDRSLQIMDANIDPSKIKPIKPRKRFKFFRAGEMPRLILDILRTAKEPVLNMDITDTIMRGKELDTGHKDTRKAVESRIRAVMQRLEKAGTVERVGRLRGSKWKVKD